MNIRHEIELKKLTQIEVAQHCGVSTKAVQSWVNGTSSPKPDHEVKLKELFGNEDSKRARQ
jgi:transcriptional regulator with XRE-family HTH domain